jgi:hypothetical protein
MHLLSLFPHTRTPLNNCNDLLSNPVWELLASTALGGLLVDHVQNPLERYSSSLPHTQRYRKFKCTTTTTGAGHVADFEKRGHRVYGNCDVQDWVEREM